jgi:hypothetical protein
MAVSAALRAACGAGAGLLVRAIVVTPFFYPPAQFLFSFACAGVFQPTIALVRT